jgi:hypothetical protein
MFIEINGRILDKRVYQRRIILLKRLLEIDFQEAAKNCGLERRREEDRRENKNVFLDRETGLRVRIVFEEAEWREV